ncbi:MAG: nicotinamide mononucleotide transporter [Candidatus Aenigmarchaeota archaeon]|nr:nicotinamide mononucleotide transporter [Candidatus Aenigmarchaeota archaeon]
MWDTISQAAIFVLGTLAIILVAKKNKWGFVAGLLSQPFWFITSFVNQQWGVIFVSIVFTLSWSYGIYEWFFKSKKKTRRSK